MYFEHLYRSTFIIMRFYRESLVDKKEHYPIKKKKKEHYDHVKSTETMIIKLSYSSSVKKNK